MSLNLKKETLQQQKNLFENVFKWLTKQLLQYGK